MRLLGLRLDDHDACLCLYDNGKVSYIKTERIYQIKHHSYDNAHQWVIDLKRIFGLTPNDIDEIAVVADPLRYNIPHIWDFTTKKYTGVDDAECDVTQVEHHYAHALSACMYPETKYQFVFDGVGEIFQSGSNINGTVWSVFKNYKLIDRATTLFETTTPSNSFGVEYENLARPSDVGMGLFCQIPSGQRDGFHLEPEVAWKGRVPSLHAFWPDMFAISLPR